MATKPVTATMEEMTKARILQAAIKDDRSFSQMLTRLCELGLKAYWNGFEPVITDAEHFLEVNKKSKSDDTK